VLGIDFPSSFGSRFILYPTPNNKNRVNMPAQERHKTGYTGVYFIWGTNRVTQKPEKIFYITYRKNSKLISEKAGRQSDGMTASRASNKRALRMTGKEPTNAEKRATERAKKEDAQNRWTLEKLWEAYQAAKPELKGWKTGTYESQWNHIEEPFGKMEPRNILPLDVKRLENQLSKTKAPQTVKHVLKLLRILCNFGQDNGLCPGLSFKIKMPSVNNIKTETLSAEQLKKLIEAIDKDTHPQAGPMMLMALFTGMRRGELFRLKWSDVDFERSFINIRDPKGGADQTIPLNDVTKKLLSNHPRDETSEYVFPGRSGNLRTRIDKAVNQIKEAANLPADFRPLQGLRHVYASTAVSYGHVEIFTVSKLLTHKDIRMTQRYAHLSNEALSRAANVTGDIIAHESASNDNLGNE
jgi:integrase